MKNKFDLKAIQALVTDADGVLWRGNRALPGLVDFFDFLRRRAIPFILATNNSTKTPRQYQQKLAGFGVTVKAEHILTCSLATAAYLRQEFNGATVYVVGQVSLRQVISRAGFSLVDEASRPADVVVVGGDTSLTYDKLKQATLLIRGGARFIGTNPDLLCPTEEGLVPEAGTILAALQAATDVAPTIIGKPERFLFDMAIERMGRQPDRTVMLGDRLDTDILGGQRAGLKTILVTTGVDNEETIPTKGIQPDAVFRGLEELTKVWCGQMRLPAAPL